MKNRKWDKKKYVTLKPELWKIQFIKKATILGSYNLDPHQRAEQGG